MLLQNEKIINYDFLTDMYIDDYFPNHLVDKIKQILLNLSEKIEQQKPEDLEQLYMLTQESTEQINDLQSEFDEAHSEIETVARDTISVDFEFIAHAYGFEDADAETLVATRDW